MASAAELTKLTSALEEAHAVRGVKGGLGFEKETKGTKRKSEDRGSGGKSSKKDATADRKFATTTSGMLTPD